MLADGGEAIRDIATLGDQPCLQGPVASAATAWGVLDAVDTGRLASLHPAKVRERRGESRPANPALTGEFIPGWPICRDASSRRPRLLLPPAGR